MASNLWSWQRAQATVRPRNVLPKTSMRLSKRSAWSWRTSTGEWTSSPRNQKPRAEDRLVEALRRVEARLLQQIAGDVFRDELVVGHVGVEGADDVIAVLVGVGDGVVELVAARLAVAHQVEPVPRPALAELRRRQQPIDHLLVGVRRLVLDEGVDLLRRRRQADQVEGHAAQQSALVGGRRRAPGPSLPVWPGGSGPPGRAARRRP